MTPLPADFIAALGRMGLIAPGDRPEGLALAGGVSSDIWRVDLAGGPVCVKRALARLKVAAEWHAPVERSGYEADWFETASAIAPEAVPRILGRDRVSGCFAMTWLDPGDHRLWKDELRAGRADPALAAEVGRRLARIHGGTAGQRDVAARFATDHIFGAIRLEPYLEATARAHPDRAAALLALVERTRAAKRALVHGDVSPKNILIGPQGPVFLDAECAWYGDPAFDLAFCLNHLLLKCLWTPSAAPSFLASFAALADAYLGAVAWEQRAELEVRAAGLLPGLFLARVDGKSPVEYLTEERDKARVRRVARALLADPPAVLRDVAAAWAGEINP